ncbi:hypothetical protein AB3N04_13125 [Alkalihalophilus sp. As8PL]|uniref:Uncharacterized protein n=1 Tax=Alkalihalophilus sp. As8PL TaxID=3237103 RepID=A0AB39BPD0_9BACI
MKSQFDQPFKQLDKDILWNDERNEQLKMDIDSTINKLERRNRFKSKLVYPSTILAFILITVVSLTMILSNDNQQPNHTGGATDAEETSDEKQYSPETQQYLEKKKRDTIINPIISGHDGMNGYVIYGWDHDNYNVENLKRSMEYRIPETEDALQVVEDPYLKKDYEEILILLLELEEKIENEEERTRLVRELQLIYRDLDYYLRNNTYHDATHVSHYGKSIREKENESN